MSGAENLILAAAALAIEAGFGYPAWLDRRIGHPVRWIGALIGATEARLNRAGDAPSMARLKGVLSLLYWLSTATVVTLLARFVFMRSPWLFPLLALFTASLPAQRSLYVHVAAVATALENEGLAAGRAAVAMIVGRNSDVLDEAGVARAAIESLAENFSDGIVAPTFWIALGGLTGGVLYKVINTADSMIGHRSKRYEFYGWASARLDDLVNLPASRLAALFLIAASACDGISAAPVAFRAVWRDAPKHRSPNAGWPEAAAAGALGLRLGGPRLYAEGPVDDGFMGDGRYEATSSDIRRALRLLRHAFIIQWIFVASLALIFIWRG